MSQISPIATSFVQTSQSQTQEATERTRQVREAQQQVKGAYVREDQVDIPVETTGEVEEIEDRKKESRKPPTRKKHMPENEEEKDESDHIDLTA